MPKFYGQNKKRSNPRYFLHENTISGDDILIKLRELIDFVDAVDASSLDQVHVERVQQELNLLKTVVSEKLGSAVSAPPELPAPLQESLVQDPIGGMVRPDQLQTNVIKDLQHCLKLAESGNYNFANILNIMIARIDIIKSIEDE